MILIVLKGGDPEDWALLLLEAYENSHSEYRWLPCSMSVPFKGAGDVPLSILGLGRQAFHKYMEILLQGDRHYEGNKQGDVMGRIWH